VKTSGRGVELSKNRLQRQEVFVSHANAALTPRARLRLARLVVDQGWPIARAAERYDVSWPTARRWAGRYGRLGPAGMGDASSRPRHSPNTTPQPVVRKIVHLRWKQRLGPVQIAAQVGVAPSTVHKVLVRCKISRLSHVDRVSGEPVRRYEHGHPGSLIHVDVKKLGNVPGGGGWRYVGRAQGKQNRKVTAHRTGQRSPAFGHPLIGTAFAHTVLDDHSRVAYAEIHQDESQHTAAAVLRNAVTWFAQRGVTTERVLSDNGSCYRSHLWRQTCADLGITPKRTRPYRPQTNGKIERFHRTLADGWAFRKFYSSESARRAALPAWLHHYNHHRPHTAIGRSAPISRLTNVSDQYN
jgi:transposase InsO family protein/transposase-like protein